ESRILGASLPGMDRLAASILASETPFAYLIFAWRLVEIYLPFDRHAEGNSAFGVACVGRIARRDQVILRSAQRSAPSKRLLRIRLTLWRPDCPKGLGVTRRPGGPGPARAPPPKRGGWRGPGNPTTPPSTSPRRSRRGPPVAP